MDGRVSRKLRDITPEQPVRYSVGFEVLSGPVIDVYVGPKEDFFDQSPPEDRDEYVSYVEEHAISGLIFLDASEGRGRAKLEVGEYVLVFRRQDLENPVTYERAIGYKRLEE
ncbi:MAG: hypothetical protein V5A44_07520 [Haloarculaceae archaeon]